MKLIFFIEISISRKFLQTGAFFPIKIPKFDLTQTPEGNKGPPIRRTYSDDIKGRVQLLEKAMSNSKYNTNDQRLDRNYNPDFTEVENLNSFNFLI